MTIKLRRTCLFGGLFLSLGSVAQPALAAAPTVAQALSLTPIQKDVDYDKPTADEAAACTIKSEKLGGKTGWVVRTQNGEILRNFIDTGNDNKVDQWCYFKDGLEVYRDVDANSNGKADQSRWFNTAGTRWGMDRDEDGKIDYWQVISPEEVSAEVVAALRDKDSARFQRLLLSAKDLKALGLGSAKVKDIAKRIELAPAAFRQLAGKQTVVTKDTKWIYFGGSRPGVVPAGTEESTADLEVYENVAAMVETGTEHAQVPIGVLVKVEGAWKLIDVPQISNDTTAEVPLKGYFIPDAIARAEQRSTGGAATPGAGDPTPKMQTLMKELEEIDKMISQTSAEKQLAKLNAERADKVEQLAEEVKEPADRAMWIKQLADTVSVAVQMNTYPEGLDRLKNLLAKIKDNEADKDAAAFVQFRVLATEYNLDLIKQQKPFNQIQAEWIKSLEQFVTDHPKSPDLGDALIQLAMAEELAGEEEKSLQWYNEITKNYASSPYAKKAEGAKRRLSIEGKPMQLVGKTLKGKTIDLSKDREFKDKVVLIHYWSTDESNTGDLPELKDLLDRYGKDFAIIGVSLESDKQRLETFLEEDPLKWPQIWEQGGLENRFANEMGILTLPTMILVDKHGKVVSRNIVANQLAKEVRSLIAPPVATKPKKSAD